VKSERENRLNGTSEVMRKYCRDAFAPAVARIVESGVKERINGVVFH
jgi:hypothetical protein